MTKIIEKLFGSEKSANELQQLHEELRIAVDNLRKLEQDWREKVSIVQQFLREWNGKWDLSKLTQRIRILKKVEEGQRKGFDIFDQSVLHVEHIMENSEISESARNRLKQIFSQEQETWKALKSSVQWQLYFIESNINRDIGLVRFHIKSFINALKKEGELLGLEKKEFNLILKIERSLEPKIRGRLLRGLNYNKRVARLYSLGFPKYHNEELVNFLVWEWKSTEKIIEESGQHSEYVFSKGIPTFLRSLSRANLLDIGIAVARLANTFGDQEAEKITSKMGNPYFITRTDVYLEVAEIIIASGENHAYVLESIGTLRDIITKNNVAKIGKDLIQIGNASEEYAATVLNIGVLNFKFLITPDNILEVGLSLAELIKNG